MSDVLHASIDGHDVAVDVSALDGVGHTGWLLPVIVVASVVAVVGAFASRGHPRRALLWASLASGVAGAAAALLSAPIVYGRIASEVPGLSGRIASGSVVVGVAGFACGALVLLVPLVFASASRAVAVGVAGLSLVAGLVGVGGIAAVQEQRRTFIAGLQQAFPLPRLVFLGQEQDPVLATTTTTGATPPGLAGLPEVHVGQRRVLAPIAWWQLGVTPTRVLGVDAGDHVAFPASDVSNWSVTDAVLAPTTPGEQTAVAIARQGAVSVTAPVRFVGVLDKSPPGFSLTRGSRISFARVNGPPGATAAALKAMTTKKKKTAREDVVVSVIDERVVDGLRVVSVHVTDRGFERTDDVIAKDGVLYTNAGVFVGADCALPFLAQPSCVCGSNGVESCAHVETDPVGAMVRFTMLIATLGVSEVVKACPGCGDGREAGLIRLR